MCADLLLLYNDLRVVALPLSDTDAAEHHSGMYLTSFSLVAVLASISPQNYNLSHYFNRFADFLYSQSVLNDKFPDDVAITTSCWSRGGNLTQT